MDAAVKEKATHASRAFGLRKHMVDLLGQSQALESAYYARVAEIAKDYLDAQSKEVSRLLQEHLPSALEGDLYAFARAINIRPSELVGWKEVVHALQSTQRSRDDAENQLRRLKTQVGQLTNWLGNVKPGLQEEYQRATQQRDDAKCRLGQLEQMTRNLTAEATQLGSRLLTVSMDSLSALSQIPSLGATLDRKAQDMERAIRATGAEYERKQNQLVHAIAHASSGLTALYGDR